jgi:PAS domain S-box-containing protein
VDRQRDVIAREASALEALRASEARFAAAFAASPIPMAITTLAEGRYVEVNEAFEQQIGYNRVEVHGKTSLDLGIWPTPADRFAMVAELNEHKRIRSRKTEFRTKSGRLITTLYSASLIEADGRPCVLAAILDVTSQRLAEDALRENEAKFRVFAEALVEHSPFGILVGGADHLVRSCNPAFERMFLYSAAEVVGRDPDELVGRSDDSEAAAISRRVLNGETVCLTTTRRRKDGSAIQVEVRAIPLISNGVFIGCFGIYRSIADSNTPQ